MSLQAQTAAIEEIVKAIDIPEEAYDMAARRYQDLAEWFSGDKAESRQYSPHIYPQGSFRLGTVIRPIGGKEEFDLDLGCRLREGISKYKWSQKKLKHLVGRDLEAYRQRRGIKEELEEKRRCWGLNYADGMSFHMDVVPSIPEDGTVIKSLRKSMVMFDQFDDDMAELVAEHAGAITDNTRENYSLISADWPVSNSEGYAIWFQSRTRVRGTLQESLRKSLPPLIDELPANNRKSPLQQAVQVLKRHRNFMYAANPDDKPASIILTTLAARAYAGEGDVVTATTNILTLMPSLVGTEWPRIPNPINRNEDFADRWVDDPSREENFWKWLEDARQTLRGLGTVDDPEAIIEKAIKGFDITPDRTRIRESLGLQTTSSAASGKIWTPTMPAVMKSKAPAVLGNDGRSG